MEADGEFSKIEVLGESISGKRYFDCIEKIANEAYFGKENNKDAVDFMWYLWCGPKSPLFGKAKAATFERYFVEEKETHKEEKNPYFALIENEEICDKILKEFGLGTKNSHIIQTCLCVNSINSKTAAQLLLSKLPSAVQANRRIASSESYIKS